jgi:virulence factor Mce-like protein
MGLKAPKLSLILVAVAFALSCFGFTLFVWKSFGGPTPFEAHSYRFHIVFGSEASQMTTNADVRIAGVSVGKVIRVQRTGNGANVLVEMESKYAPVPKDTRAIVRFKSLLGEAFVALTPGHSGAPKLPENATLDARNIGKVQQIDEVLGAFDAPTRLAFTQFLRDTAKVLDHRSQDINDALGNLAPTSEAVAKLLTTLDHQKQSLQSLVRDSAVALRAISARQEDLRSLIRAGKDVFGATAEQSTALTETVRAFPPFLRETRGALRDIDALAIEAGPTLRALRPAIPLLRPALVEGGKLAPVIHRTFDGLDPVITEAGRGLPALDQILKATHPALKVLYVSGRELIPVADYLRHYRTDVVASIAKVAAAVNFPVTTSDGGIQRILRSMFIITDETPTNASQRLASNRHNAYPLPGELARVGNGGIRASDCRNVNNPQTVPVIGKPSPPCVVSPQFSFRGQLRTYPHVKLAPR